MIRPYLARLRWGRTCQLGEKASIERGGRVENIRGAPEFVSIGDHSIIAGRLLTYGHGGNINIGDHCFVGERSEIWSMSDIRIGNRVLISYGCNIHDGNGHSFDATKRHEHYRGIISAGHPREDVYKIPAAPVVIEDDAWLSFGVTVLKGVRIGAGSIIAAGSTVTEDVPAGMFFFNRVTPVMRPITSLSDLTRSSGEP